MAMLFDSLAPWDKHCGLRCVYKLQRVRFESFVGGFIAPVINGNMQNVIDCPFGMYILMRAPENKHLEEYFNGLRDTLDNN